MSIVDNFLKKMKVVSEDEDYDEYDDEEQYDDYEDENETEDDLDDEEEEVPAKKKTTIFSRPSTAYTQRQPSNGNTNVVGLKTKGNGAEVCMIVPKSYNDANTIADVLLSHRAVVLNLENNDMASAQRIIDFASGACYTVGGSLQKISRKIFMIVPQDMNLSGDFEALVNEMVDLNSVSMLK